MASARGCGCFLTLTVFLCVLAGCQAAPTAGPPIGEVSGTGEADLGPQSTHAKGEQRVLMLAVRFKDVEPKMSLDRIRERAVGRLNDYVKTQSYGQAWITPHFIGWVLLPDNLSAYRVSADNFQVDPSAVEGTGTARIMDADPASPHFTQATYRHDRSGRRKFVDRVNGVAIVALGAEGQKRTVLMTTPQQATAY